MKTILYALLAITLLSACGPHMRDGVQKDSEALADKMQRFTMSLNEE